MEFFELKIRRWILCLLTITAFLTFTIHAFGQTSNYSPNLSLNLKNKNIKEIFTEIEKVSQFVFIYLDKDIDLERKLTINISNQKIEKILDQVVKSANLNYSIKNKQIYISKPLQSAPDIDNKKKDNPKLVTGKVTDSNGEPLIGAVVLLKNTDKVTVTNAEGLFVIDEVMDGEILVFRYISFLSKEVPIRGNTINVALEEDAQMMEEVVVVGYGQQKKSSVVSSVSSIGSRELRAPTPNLTNNLAGQLAGLISIQRSGEPGRDDAEFWIRGISTFAGGKKPLVLVDGIPRDIANIEPDEIESFSLLKDAAATAVYGAEGANGVILVTSKRGLISKPKVSFRAEYSLAQPTRLPEFVDSWQYLELANEAHFNDGMDPYISPLEIEKYKARLDNDLYPNSKWIDELLKETTANQRYTLNFRGGAENAQYFVSMAYFHQDGIFKENPMEKYKGNLGLDRYNLRSNVDLRVTSTTKLNIDLSGQYVNRQSSSRSTDEIFSFMLNTPPHLFPSIYSDGTISTYPAEIDDNNRNPYNMLMNEGYKREWNTKIQSNIGIIQDLNVITSGLKFNGKISLDYDGNFSTTRTYNPSRYHAIGRDADDNLIYTTSVAGTSTFSDPQRAETSVRKIYLEGAFNYSRNFAKHTVGGMFLYMQKESQIFNDRERDILPYRKQGLVGRVTYSYDNRYFIEGNFGYTGSETFAKKHRFGFFPAVGLGYYISNESFYPRAMLEIMNKVKFRFSLGRAGNDDTGSDRFFYRADFKMDAGGFDQGIASNGGTNGLGKGIYDVREINHNLGWETENKLNIGVDLGFFNNKIELIADYFHNRRDNILLQRKTLPGVAGFHQNPWANFGIVDNWGVDGSLNGRHSFGPVQVSMRGTFTFARNKIVEYDELTPEYPWMSVTGGRIGEQFLYVVERLYTDNDFIKIQNSNGTYDYKLRPGVPEPAINGKLGPGDLKFVDQNNDGIIDYRDRIQGIGHPYNPEINYGFGANVEWKGLYLSVFFQGTGNSSVLLASGNDTFWPFNWGAEKSNYRTAFLDKWSAENPSQDVLMPRLHANYNNNINKESSTFWLRDASFIRLKNLEVGYTIPKNIVGKMGLENVRVYMLGNNLYVWDKIKYWDPELGNKNKGNSYPLSRTYTFGLEVNF